MKQYINSKHLKNHLNKETLQLIAFLTDLTSKKIFKTYLALVSNRWRTPAYTAAVERAKLPLEHYSFSRKEQSCKTAMIM